MQTEFNEKVGEFYKTASKPIAKITELNIATINKLSSNTNLLSDLAQAKKPEDFINAQIKLVNAVAVESMEYLQQACGIWLEAFSQTGNTLATAARDVRENTKKAANKATENINPSKL